MDETADIIEQLREMAEKGDGLPQTYYNQLILTAMIAQSRQLQSLIDTTRTIETKLTAIEQDQKRMAEIDHQVQQMNSRLSRQETLTEQNPSLVWLLRFRTRPTLITLAIIIALALMILVSDIRHPIFSALGIPPNLGIPQP